MKKPRQRWRNRLIILCIILFTLPVQAGNNTLSEKLNALVNGAEENSATSITRHAVLLTPPEKLTSLCAEPHLSLSGGQRLTGNRTVVARCGNKKHFLQIRIEAEGTWWVAARNMKTGSVLSREDVVSRRGSLANLPAGVVMNIDAIHDAVLTRPARAGQPLMENQLRKSWRIHRGEEVDIIAYGNGFHIMARGQALNNAVVNDAVRVRMKNGQLVSGRVNKDGSVRINL